MTSHMIASSTLATARRILVEGTNTSTSCLHSQEADVQKPTEVAESPKQMKMTHWLTQNSKSDSERLHDTNEVKTSATQSHFTNPTNANTWSVKNGARESDKIPCVVTKGNSKEFKNNHSKRVFSLKKMKLAFHLAREMRNFHYENCKIKWEMCFAYSFARESLMKNARKQTILRAWDLAVHQKQIGGEVEEISQIQCSGKKMTLSSSILS